jgi:hypothetical protein
MGGAPRCAGTAAPWLGYPRSAAPSCMICAMRRVALVLLVGSLLVACGSSSSSTSSTTSTSATNATSSSFVPWRQLHSVHITVARPGLPPPYGQPKTKSFITPADVARVTGELNRHHIARQVPPTPNHGCAGGTTIAITIAKQHGASVNLNAYRCGGGRSGDVAGDLTGFLAAVQAPS